TSRANSSLRDLPAVVQPEASDEKAPVPVADGSEELFQAHRYLDGHNVPRNPAIAANWLWKSVSKQNSEAALLLADLYQHGVGVPRNGDQARVLLMAAAKKATPGAVEKLRVFDAGSCR